MHTIWLVRIIFVWKDFWFTRYSSMLGNVLVIGLGINDTKIFRGSRGVGWWGRLWNERVEGRRTANGCFGECVCRQTGNMRVKPGGCGGVIRLLELITYLSWPCTIPLSACLAVVRVPSGLLHRRSMLDSVIRVFIYAFDLFPSFFEVSSYSFLGWFFRRWWYWGVLEGGKGAKSESACRG